jgi:hypothetical protein
MQNNEHNERNGTEGDTWRNARESELLHSFRAESLWGFIYSGRSKIILQCLNCPKPTTIIAEGAN